MVQLRAVEKFGEIDADADTLLAECFEDHDAFVAARDHRKPLVIGRKGSGKTAIFKKLLRASAHDTFAVGHTFADYPWNHHKIQGLSGVPPELCYVPSWTYLILMTVSRVLLGVEQSTWNEGQLDEINRLRNFVTDCYGTTSPDLTQIFQPSKQLRVKAFLRTPGGTGAEIERVAMNDLPKVIQEVNDNITAAVLECVNSEHNYYICFDELDRGFDPNDKEYISMLIGLILAAKTLNNKARQAGKKFSVVVFLRDDIYQSLRFEDKNKITEGFASFIRWDVGGQWTLKNLMLRRFQKTLGANVQWTDVFDDSQEMPGRQSKYQHILTRTFNRPRDIIRFCNEILGEFKTRTSGADKFINSDIANSRPTYSEYLLSELEDEVHKHEPDYDNYLELVRSVGRAGFSFSEFQAVCERRPDLIKKEAPRDAVLRRLFEFSVVAYQKTGGSGGGSEYVWRYLDSRARFDESARQFRVHPGLVEALGLKRFGRADEGESADEA